MDMVEIKKRIGEKLGFIDEYKLESKQRAELDRSRVLQDIEVHGVTGQQRLTERLFVGRSGKIEELAPKPHVIRRKTYGGGESHEEQGDAIGALLNERDDWVAIVRSAFVTKPKGPHGTEKTLELYS